MFRLSKDRNLPSFGNISGGWPPPNQPSFPSAFTSVQPTSVSARGTIGNSPAWPQPIPNPFGVSSNPFVSSALEGNMGWPPPEPVRASVSTSSSCWPATQRTTTTFPFSESGINASSGSGMSKVNATSRSELARGKIFGNQTSSWPNQPTSTFPSVGIPSTKTPTIASAWPQNKFNNDWLQTPEGQVHTNPLTFTNNGFNYGPTSGNPVSSIFDTKINTANSPWPSSIPGMNSRQGVTSGNGVTFNNGVTFGNGVTSDSSIFDSGVTRGNNGISMFDSAGARGNNGVSIFDSGGARPNNGVSIFDAIKPTSIHGNLSTVQWPGNHSLNDESKYKAGAPNANNLFNQIHEERKPLFPDGNQFSTTLPVHLNNCGTTFNNNSHENPRPHQNHQNGTGALIASIDEDPYGLALDNFVLAGVAPLPASTETSASSIDSSHARQRLVQRKSCRRSHAKLRPSESVMTTSMLFSMHSFSRRKLYLPDMDIPVISLQTIAEQNKFPLVTKAGYYTIPSASWLQQRLADPNASDYTVDFTIVRTYFGSVQWPQVDIRLMPTLLDDLVDLTVGSCSIPASDSTLALSSFQYIFQQQCFVTLFSCFPKKIQTTTTRYENKLRAYISNLPHAKWESYDTETGTWCFTIKKIDPDITSK